MVPAEFVPKPRPLLGDIVTFSYDSFARRAVPVNPKISRIRIDISWEHVTHSHDVLFLNGKGDFVREMSEEGK